MSEFEQVVMAKSVSAQAMMQRRNVVGVGVGYRSQAGRGRDELSVVVLVRRKLPQAALSESDLAPQEVMGIRTDVVEVGDLRPWMFARLAAGVTARQRPAPGGVSIGHYQITAGTLGCMVRDRASGRPLILSNNHVLANSNAGAPGDPILQPGPADGGQMGRDTFAYLERFIPLRYASQPASCNLAQAYAAFGNRLAAWMGASHRLQALNANPNAINRVDAALARPMQDSDLLAEIVGEGAIQGQAVASLGMTVTKCGRTTGATSGVIQVLEASVQINYGDNHTARFDGQIVASPMSEGGDSGSLVLESAGKRAVGLLFAGSAQATIFNPIQDVLDHLQVDLPGPARAGERRSSAQKVLAIKDAYQSSLLQRPNVVGVGVGLQRKNGKRTGEVGLVVMVERKVPKGLLRPDEIIPDEIEGVPVDIKEVGRIESQ